MIEGNHQLMHHPAIRKILIEKAQEKIMRQKLPFQSINHPT